VKNVILVVTISGKAVPDPNHDNDSQFLVGGFNPSEKY